MVSKKHPFSHTGFILLALLACTTAAGHTIDFEGLADRELVHTYYKGGHGLIEDEDGNLVVGTAGTTDLGVTFFPDARVAVSKSVGGSGNFLVGSNPSGSRVGFFLQVDSGEIGLQVENGFKDQLTFHYSSPYATGAVSLYRPDHTLITSIVLGVTIDTDPTGIFKFGDWRKITLPFSGTAGYAMLSGDANKIAFDDIEFVPVPDAVSSFGLTGMSLALLACLRRRR
ncbi:MAG: hypothetical protein SFV32_07500 [Opitutaceae bacterium]|nr:hypothetical protein [Opitutaceae bacterium]